MTFYSLKLYNGKNVVCNYIGAEMKGEKQKLTAEELLEEIRILCKESFIATVRKKGDEIELKFPGGETFLLTLWELPQNA